MSKSRALLHWLAHQLRNEHQPWRHHGTAGSDRYRTCSRCGRRERQLMLRSNAGGTWRREPLEL